MTAPIVHFSDAGVSFAFQVLNCQLSELGFRFEAFSLNHAGVQGMNITYCKYSYTLLMRFCSMRAIGVVNYMSSNQNISKKNATKSMIQKHLHTQLCTSDSAITISHS